MTDKKETRGGARANAGRPKNIEVAKSRTIRLLDADWLKFKALGGVSWLKEFLTKIPN